jgi:hypothetical protein
MSSPGGRSGRVGAGARVLRRSMAVLGLSVLLGSLALPLLGLVLADEPAPFCCRGCCCCTGDGAGADDRACLRRGCGCEHPDATVAGAPVRIEAVLPAMVLPARPESRSLEGAAAFGGLLTRPHAPPVPPPRRPLPA